MLKNINEMYSKYSKVLPYWVLNQENKPTLEAFQDYVNSSNFTLNNNDLFRYDERSLDTLTIISKDPDIKYLILDISTTSPMVEKPFYFTDFHYYVEKVSFYSQGVWKIEFKRDYITLWIQFLQNIRSNNFGNIRTLTTRTNLIDDNYQFEDEKLSSLPLKISGWKVEELVAPSNILSAQDMPNGKTNISIDYKPMEAKWRRNLGDGNFKEGLFTMDLELNRRGEKRTSFCEYYVFNTESHGMIYVPKIDIPWRPDPGIIEAVYGEVIIDSSRIQLKFLTADYVEQQLVNKRWASQFVGIFILPNWLTTSIPWKQTTFTFYNADGSLDKTFQLTHFPFGINSTEIMTIDYQIPEKLKVNIANRKLGVKDKLVANSIFQSLPIHLNYTNSEFNFQKHPDFFDWENNIMNFKYNFIFSGQGIAMYYSKYEPLDSWIKNLPNQLPSSTSKFAQYIQANQNTLQTGIWVKQEEAKLNRATGIANALTGVAGAGISLFGMFNIISKSKKAIDKAYATSTGSLGTAHGLNQAVQGITNALRAENEVKFEQARVKAKYTDTFNSSSRQINYSQAIDALSKEFTEGRICDIIVFPLVDNLEVYNDTIVRCGNKTYDYFKLNELLTVGEDKKFNYFEVNAENFFKETSNFPSIWKHFSYEEISMILDWLEEGVRLWKTQEIEYDYQE